MLDWLLDNIAGGLLLALILAVAGFSGRRWLVSLWDRRPWPRIDRVPRTPTETRQLLAVRPNYWEYLLLGGELHQRLSAHDARYRDHEAKYVRPSGLTVPDDGLGDFVSEQIDWVLAVIANWEGLINDGALAQALGEPGEPGDAERIEHVAERLTSTYLGLMDWSDRLRGARAPRYRALIDIIARYVDYPIRQYREWVDHVVTQCDKIPALLRDKKRGPMKIELMLTIRVPDEVIAEFNAELQRVEAREVARRLGGDPDDVDP